jgi:hypothetical protein
VGAGLDGIKERKGLTEVLGPGAVTDEDDGVVYAEAWASDGLAVHADYRESGELKVLQFSLPLRSE